MPEQSEFNLRDLNDQELTEQVHDDLYNGLRDEVMEATNIFLERGWGAEKVLNDALVEGMRIVGIDFRDGILFVPEVLLAANSMKGGMEILRPLLAETGAEPIGKVVIGTVKGDIHDIGKNLVSMMLEGAGFEVIDLGINNSVEKYLDALEKHKPDILGMSALLTTTMPYMKVVIDKLREENLRDKYIVLVGGAPLNEEFGKAVGADAYCRDAAVAVETAKSLIASAPGRARCLSAAERTWTTGRRNADHRLRSAGTRDRGSAPRERLDGHRCLLPAAASCTIVPSGSPRQCRRRSAPIAASTAASSSPTAIAAPAASWMRCSRKKASSGCRAPTVMSFSPARAPSRSWRKRAGDLLPDGLPHAPLRAAGGTGARHRSPSGARAGVLPQLPQGGLSRPDPLRGSSRAGTQIASNLGLAFEHRHTGYGELGAHLAAARRSPTGSRHGNPDHHLLARHPGAGDRP